MKLFFAIITLLLLTSCSVYRYTATTSESLSCDSAIDSTTVQEGAQSLVSGGYIFYYSGSTCFVDPTFKKISTILSGTHPHSTQRQYLALSTDLATAYFMEITIDDHKDIKNGFIIKKLSLSAERPEEVEVQQFFTSKEIFSANTRNIDPDHVYIEYEENKALILDMRDGSIVETSVLSFQTANNPESLKYVQVKDGNFTHPLSGQTWEVPKVTFAYDSVRSVVNEEDTKAIFTFARSVDSRNVEIHLLLLDLTIPHTSFKEIASGTYPIEINASDSNVNCLRYDWPAGMPKGMGIMQETCHSNGREHVTIYSFDEATAIKTLLPFKKGSIFEVRDERCCTLPYSPVQ